MRRLKQKQEKEKKSLVSGPGDVYPLLRIHNYAPKNKAWTLSKPWDLAQPVRLEYLIPLTTLVGFL